MKLYLQLNEPGSGELTVPYDSARAADLTIGSYAELKYRGMVMGGFWVENRKYKTIGAAEEADRMLTVTGRGALAILDDAILWDWMTPGYENTRFFWNSPDTVSVPNMHHKGQILHQILACDLERQLLQVNNDFQVNRLLEYRLQQ